MVTPHKILQESTISLWMFSNFFLLHTPELEFSGFLLTEMLRLLFYMYLICFSYCHVSHTHTQWLSYLSFLLIMKQRSGESFSWLSLGKPGLDFGSSPELYPVTDSWTELAIRNTWGACEDGRCLVPALRDVWRAWECAFGKQFLVILLCSRVKIHCVTLYSFIHSTLKYSLNSYYVFRLSLR